MPPRRYCKDRRNFKYYPSLLLFPWLRGDILRHGHGVYVLPLVESPFVYAPHLPEAGLLVDSDGSVIDTEYLESEGLYP